MTFSLAVLAIFICAAVLMFLRKLPAILALPLLAVCITGLQVFAGKLTWNDLLAGVIADGAVRLADPIVISFFGGMLSFLMQKTGVAENMVKRGAELAGDNPWAVSVLMLMIVALLFTTVGGLGAVIMVGTVILPILLSLGVREHIAAGVLLFGISLGGTLNPNNWAMYRSILHLTDETVSSYALIVFATTFVAALVFLTFELVRAQSVRLVSLGRSFVWLAVIGAVLIGARFLLGPGSVVVFQVLVLLAGVAAIAQAFVRYVRSRHSSAAPIPTAAAYAIPLVPLLLILLFGIPFVPAFAIGLVYGILVTLRRGTINLTSRAIIEGSASVIPAVILMIGIGMLLSAILGPTPTGPGKGWYESHPPVVVEGQPPVPPEWPVLTDMKPLLESIAPRSLLSYVVIFSLLGPLALYRGPMNVWGLGYGVGGVLLATGVSPGAIMGMLMSLGIIQGVSDPTNTQNVWISNEVRLDVNTLLWRTLPYAWGAAIVGLIAAGFRFF